MELSDNPRPGSSGTKIPLASFRMVRRTEGVDRLLVLQQQFEDGAGRRFWEDVPVADDE